MFNALLMTKGPGRKAWLPQRRRVVSSAVTGFFIV